MANNEVVQMQRKIVFSALAAALLGLAACTEEAPTTAAAPESPFRLTATIQDIMQTLVDPPADFLWAAVGTTITEAGTVEHQPRTDEEWALVRRNALTLIEATNLLTMEGRRVAAEGKQIEDADLEGVLTPAEIQQKIDENRAAFIAYAHVLHDAGMEALAAIEARNLDGLTEVGEKLDQACEQCHRVYWYPNTQEPINSRESATTPAP